jgi:uncharacterized protein involved in outer membrane biogenesis
MKRWLGSWWFRLGGGLLVLLLLAVGALFALAPIDRARPAMARLLEDAVGRKVEIGALRLRLFPAVAVRVSDIHVKNPAGLPPGDTVAIKSVDFQVVPRALLSRRLEVTHVTVDGVRIQMLRVGGKTNLETQAAPRSTARPSTAGPSAPPFIAFDRVTSTSIKNIVFVYSTYDQRKRQAVASLTIGGLSVTLGNVRPGAPDALKRIELVSNLRGVTISTPSLVKPLQIQTGEFTFKDGAGRGSAALALDKMRGDASVTISGIDPFSAKFTIVIPEVDVAAIEAVLASGGPAGAGGASMGDAGAEHRLLAKGSVQINRIVVTPLDAQRFSGVVNVYTNTIEVDSYSVDVQGGTARGRAKLDYSAPALPAQATAQVRGVDLARVVKRAAPTARRVTGTLDADLRVATSFAVDAKAALTGTGSFGVRNGVFQGLDLQGNLAQAAKGLQLNVPAGDTPFTYFGGDLRIAGQRVYSEALRLEAETMEGTARGSLGFNKTLDYTGVGVLKRLAGTPGGSGPLPSLGQTLDNTVKTISGLGVRVPFTLKGTFDDPKFALAGTPQPLQAPRPGRERAPAQPNQNPLDLLNLLKPKN